MCTEKLALEAVIVYATMDENTELNKSLVPSEAPGVQESLDMKKINENTPFAEVSNSLF